MRIRSKFLVHWTGNDFSPTRSDDARQRAGYVGRLRDDYLNGLYARKCDEGTIRHVTLKRLVRLCFTEIRLSQVETHAGRYGRLGIGFDRKFIINRGGRPVIYVPFEATEKLMEDNIAFVFNNSTGTVHERLKFLLAFVKRMSDKPTTYIDSQDFLEELEWRVVYGESLDPGHYKRFADGTYRWGFAPEDVRLLVLPDEETKIMALTDAHLKPLFDKHTPIMLTVEDCGNF